MPSAAPMPTATPGSVLLERFKALLPKSEAVALFSMIAAIASAIAAIGVATSTRRLERPWVIVIPASPPEQEMPPTATAPAILAMPYSLSNIGRSPGWIRDDFVKAEVVPWPDVPEDKALSKVSNGPMTIPIARDKNAIPSRYPTVALDAQQRQDIMDGKAGILVHGQIHYRDVFWKTRVHAFGWVYTRADDSLPLHDRVWPEKWGPIAEADMWVIHQAPDRYSKNST
ncbi:hypothetical protein K2Z84_32035 [Candidatus Binatia bacterium]|nr:hypothetical protein [Candidatus Binatia bacterium]